MGGIILVQDTWNANIVKRSTVCSLVRHGVKTVELGGIEATSSCVDLQVIKAAQFIVLLQEYCSCSMQYKYNYNWISLQCCIQFFYRYSCDIKVVRLMRERTLGNSSTKLQKQVAEQHIECHMNRAMQFLQA